jgi:hypothetical protein
MTDDEITLARAWALVAARYPQRRYAAVSYALCDAGTRLAEIAAIRTADLLGDGPDMLLAGGTQRRDARFLSLETFHRTVLATIADPTSARGHALLARSREDNSTNAGESATRALNSFTADLGLSHADLVPSSVARWRVRHAWDTQDLDAAIAVAGTSKAAVESELGITRVLKSNSTARPRASVTAM